MTGWCYAWNIFMPCTLRCVPTYVREAMTQPRTERGEGLFFICNNLSRYFSHNFLTAYFSHQRIARMMMNASIINLTFTMFIIYNILYRLIESCSSWKILKKDLDQQRKWTSSVCACAGHWHSQPAHYCKFEQTAIISCYQYPVPYHLRRAMMTKD